MKAPLLALILLLSALLAPGTFAQAPANDAFAARQVLSAALPRAASGTTVSATAEAGEPGHADVFGGNVASNSVWFQWTPSFDGFVKVTVTDAAFDSAMAVYTGTTFGSLTELDSSDAFIVGDEVTTVPVQTGVAYMIAVDGFSTSSTVGESGTFTLEISRETAAPNDNFGSANVLVLGANPLDGSAIEATVEAGEPNHASIIGGNEASNSVWFRWVAPSSGLFGIDVSGAFDFAVAVYTGSDVAALNEVGASDFYETQAPERAVFPAVSGTQYFIAVDGFSATGTDGAAGLFQIQVLEVPGNDDFFNRTTINPTLPSSDTGTTVNGSSEFVFGEPDHGNVLSVPGNLSSNSVWYSWTAPGDGTVMVEVANPQFDPVLAVYTGDAVGVLTEVAAVDSGDFLVAESLTFEAVSGTVYSIAVDDWSSNGQPGSGGTFTLNLTGDLTSGGAPYANWIAGFPDLIGAEAEPGAAPLGDGVTNLLKLILGLNPTIRIEDDPNKANFPVLTTFNGNSALRYTVSPANLGSGENAVQHAGQISDDLSDWSNTAAQSIGGDAWVIEIPSIGTDQRFARLVGTLVEN